MKVCPVWLQFGLDAVVEENTLSSAASETVCRLQFGLDAVVEENILLPVGLNNREVLQFGLDAVVEENPGTKRRTPPGCGFNSASTLSSRRTDDEDASGAPNDGLLQFGLDAVVEEN